MEAVKELILKGYANCVSLPLLPYLQGNISPELRWPGEISIQSGDPQHALLGGSIIYLNFQSWSMRCW